MPIFELRGIRSLLYIKVGLNATDSAAFRPVDKHSVNICDKKSLECKNASRLLRIAAIVYAAVFSKRTAGRTFTHVKHSVNLSALKSAL